jgi:hypothetical protein
VSELLWSLLAFQHVSNAVLKMRQVVLLLTIAGTVGTYLSFVKSQQLKYGLQFDINNHVSEATMRLMRLGRISQLGRMLYKNKSMFDVMSRVFQTWKAIVGVCVFTAFALSMVALISMHLMGGGLGPGRSGCYTVSECNERSKRMNECPRGDYMAEYIFETTTTGMSYKAACKYHDYEWVPAVPLDQYPRSNFETFSAGLRTSLQLMLGDDWSPVMWWYMKNGKIRSGALPFVSLLWLGLHGILFSMFVAVLLINFSVDEADKIPNQLSTYWKRDQVTKNVKQSILIMALAHESGPTMQGETTAATTRQKALMGSYIEGEKNPKSLYLFSAASRIRLLCARIEDNPKSTNFFMFMVALSLFGLSCEGYVYSLCLPVATDAKYTAEDAHCPLLVSDGIYHHNANTTTNVTESPGPGANTTNITASPEQHDDGQWVRDNPWFDSESWKSKSYVTRNLCTCNADGTRNFHDYFRWAEYSVLLCFFLELIIKSITSGFLFNAGPTTPYLRKTLNRLNFVAFIVLTDSFTDWVGLTDDDRQKQLVRGLVPMVALLSHPGIGTVITSFVKSLPGIVTVLTPTVFVGMMFSVVGVEYFGGSFKRCVCPDTGEVVHGELQCNGSRTAPVITGADCRDRGYDWINPPGLGHFDNTVAGLMTLWKLATSGYVATQELAMDVKRTTYEQVPNANGGTGTVTTQYVGVRDNSVQLAWYFVLFHLVFNFFLLNLFIGVMSSTFSIQTGRAIVTLGQKKWQQCVQMIEAFHPVFTAEEAFRPVIGQCSFYHVREPLFRIVIHRYFHIWSVAAILANVALLCFEHYPMQEEVEWTIYYLNSLFLLWFTIEFLSKLLAFGRVNYFSDGWLVLDAAIVMSSVALRIGGLASGMELLKILRCFRLLLVMKSLETLIDLMRVVAHSILNASNVAVILLVILYIYATMCMRLFSECPFGDAINANNNFRTFTSSVRVLFQITTGQQYTAIMAELLAAEQTYVDFETGKPFLEEEQQSELSIFCLFASYYFLSVFICVNLFVVTILDSFDVQTKVDQDVEAFHMWGFTYAWADLTIGAHACPALSRSAAKEFVRRLEPMLQQQSEERLRTNRAVQVRGIPDTISIEGLSSLFGKYGTIAADCGISIRRCQNNSIENYAIITFHVNQDSDFDAQRIELEVREIDGHPVRITESKSGGKYANGVAHIKLPDEEDLKDDSSGTLTVAVVSCTLDNMYSEPTIRPYCRVTSVAKHRHHGGSDSAKFTRSVAASGDNATSPQVLASSPGSPRSVSAKMLAGLTCEPGSYFWAESFRWHVNEHSKEFLFQVFDSAEMTHTALLGSATISIGDLKRHQKGEKELCLTIRQRQLVKEDRRGRVTKEINEEVGSLTVHVNFSCRTYVPEFDFLKDFGADNAHFKERNSCGIEGWLYVKRDREHCLPWQKRWFCVCQHPEPCLKTYSDVGSEVQLEQLGRTNTLHKRSRVFAPHELINISNGLTETEPKTRIGKVYRSCSQAHQHHRVQRLAQAQLAECQFQFQTVDEVEYVRNEDTTYHNDFAGVVHIHIIKAEEIPSMDNSGLTDAYVTCALEEDCMDQDSKFTRQLQDGASHTTNIVKKTLAPEWNEAFAFRLHTRTQSVRFTIGDHDPIGHDDVIADIHIPIQEIIDVEGGRMGQRWFDLQPAASSGRLLLDLQYASPLESEAALIRWSEEDMKNDRLGKQVVTWRFRAPSVDLKYAWVHALKWLEAVCTDHHTLGRAPSLPAPTVNKFDLRLAVNNTALMDLPFLRVRHFLYNLYRFRCFGVQNNRNYLLYAVFQLELHAWKQPRSVQHRQRLIPKRMGASAHLGVSLEDMRGLDYHKTMTRLALINPLYGKSQSLMYEEQMQEYTQEVRTVALHIIQTAVAHWVFTFQARKQNGRFPTAVFWRRSKREADVAVKRAAELRKDMESAKLSELRHEAIDINVSQRILDQADDMIDDEDTAGAKHMLVEAILVAHSAKSSRVNTGTTKTSFFVASRSVRDVRLATLKLLLALVKRHDPILMHGDPVEARKNKQAAKEAMAAAGMAPSEAIGCLNRRRMKKIQKLATDATENALAFTEKVGDSVSSRVEAGLDMAMDNAVGRAVGEVADKIGDGLIDVAEKAEKSIGAVAGAITDTVHSVEKITGSVEKSIHNSLTLSQQHSKASEGPLEGAGTKAKSARRKLTFEKARKPALP